MLERIIQGHDDPEDLASLALGRLRTKKDELVKVPPGTVSGRSADDVRPTSGAVSTGVVLFEAGLQPRWRLEAEDVSELGRFDAPVVSAPASGKLGRLPRGWRTVR